MYLQENIHPILSSMLHLCNTTHLTLHMRYRKIKEEIKENKRCRKRGPERTRITNTRQRLAIIQTFVGSAPKGKEN